MWSRCSWSLGRPLRFPSRIIQAPSDRIGVSHFMPATFPRRPPSGPGCPGTLPDRCRHSTTSCWVWLSSWSARKPGARPGSPGCSSPSGDTGTRRPSSTKDNVSCRPCRCIGADAPPGAGPGQGGAAVAGPGDIAMRALVAVVHGPRDGCGAVRRPGPRQHARGHGGCGRGGRAPPILPAGTGHTAGRRGLPQRPVNRGPRTRKTDRRGVLTPGAAACMMRRAGAGG